MTVTTENIYTGDGSTTLFSFTFPYIEATDVKVSLDGVDITTYSLANATTVETDTAPGSGVTVRVYRQTDSSAAVAQFFPGSVIRAQDLNANFEQSLYVVQEAETIIGNSDAASVTVIANEALTTANQASNTANAIAGTANTALATANSAQSNATSAQAAAAAASAAASAAQTTANSAVQPSDSVGVLTDVTVGTPTVGQALVWDGSVFTPGDVATDNGDPDIIGLAAWATFDGLSGTADVNRLLGGSNIASIVRTTTGTYTVTFTNPMPNADYSIVFGQQLNIGVSNPSDTAQVLTKTASSFVVTTGFTSWNGGTATNNLRDQDRVDFQVVATNSLPPRGTTGADGWATVTSAGVVEASYNIATCTKSGTGIYDYTFTTPLPTADYAVIATAGDFGSPEQRTCSVFSKTTSGFQVRVTYANISGGTWPGIDAVHQVVVHATNANLPETITMSMWDDLVARVTALENP